jgi:hypothetical protein
MYLNPNTFAYPWDMETFFWHMDPSLWESRLLIFLAHIMLSLLCYAVNFGFTDLYPSLFSFCSLMLLSNFILLLLGIKL